MKIGHVYNILCIKWCRLMAITRSQVNGIVFKKSVMQQLIFIFEARNIRFIYGGGKWISFFESKMNIHPSFFAVLSLIALLSWTYIHVWAIHTQLQNSAAVFSSCWAPARYSMSLPQKMVCHRVVSYTFHIYVFGKGVRPWMLNQIACRPLLIREQPLQQQAWPCLACIH